MCKLTISVFDFLHQISTENVARLYFEKQRWGGKPACPRCNNSKRITARKGKLRGRYVCGVCKFNFSVRTGTVMEATNISLRKWLFAIYLLMTARKGISALQLSKEIGVQHRSAWFMLHRLRVACGNELCAQRLNGIVEVDEMVIGGSDKTRHANKKKGAAYNPIVIGAKQRGGNVVIKKIKYTDTTTLCNFVRGNVDGGSTVYTDDNPGYKKLQGGSFAHDSVNHSANEYVRGKVHTNGIENVWSMLQRGLTGTYHQFSKKHLQKYLDEFAFRLGEANCEVHTLERINTLIRKMSGARLKYDDMVANN